MLWRRSDGGIGIDLTSLSDFRPAVDIDVGHELGPGPDGDMFTDHRIGTDDHILAQLSLGMHDCCWMNLHVPSHSSPMNPRGQTVRGDDSCYPAFSSVTIAVSSAWHTRSDST